MSFEVEWTSEAWSGIRALSALERRLLLDAAAALARSAERAPRDRSRLPGARPGDSSRCVRILRVVIGCPPGPLVMTAVEARELERRGRTLWKLGGGIPHEVVRRAWLAEVARDLS
jgi:hypothetical protein